VNRYLTLLLLAALLVAGCIVYNVQADRRDTKTWPVAGIAAIDIRADNGAISIRASTDTVISAKITMGCKGTSQADAEAHLADITVGDSMSGTTLYMWGKIPQANARSYNTEFEVSAPATSLLRIETKNGAVTLDSMAGAAVVVATSGAVGTVAHSGSISVEAANGAIDCDIAALDTGEAAALHSANGRVTLYLPAGASFVFDITTTNGKANVTGFTNANYSTNEATHKTGIVGTGAAAVKLHSENGNVNIQGK
jgi:hypothetical protein